MVSVSREGKKERTYVKLVIAAPQTVEEEVSVDLIECPKSARTLNIGTPRMRPSNLWLDQNKINEQHHKIMLDISVGEPLAARTLC